MSKRPLLRVRPPADAAELRRYVDVIYQSFGGFGQPAERTHVWVNHIGAENIRVAEQAGELVAGLGLLYFGQWFGGRSVPCAGISVVGVSPEARGGGAATVLMRNVVKELYQRGVPLSALYPSTYALYRKAGFEPAGARHQYSVPPRLIGVTDRALTLRPYTEADRNAVERVAADRARRTAGNLDRTRREWDRILTFGTDRIYAYVVEGAAGRGVAGYIVFTQTGQPGKQYEMVIRDMAASSPEAALRILSFFGDHATMTEAVVFESGSVEPVFTLAREEYWQPRWRQLWMLRIVDVAKALEVRGYPAILKAELQLEVSDDLVSQNSGRFVLRVAGGKGRVRRGGRGRIKLDIRGLAPLYTGHLSAPELELSGLVAGRESDLAAASVVFAGPSPWMNDRF